MKYSIKHLKLNLDSRIFASTNRPFKIFTIVLKNTVETQIQRRKISKLFLKKTYNKNQTITIFPTHCYYINTYIDLINKIDLKSINRNFELILVISSTYWSIPYRTSDEFIYSPLKITTTLYKILFYKFLILTILPKKV